MELSWSFYRSCAWEGADPSSFKILLLITSYLGMTHYFCGAKKTHPGFFHHITDWKFRCLFTFFTVKQVLLSSVVIMIKDHLMIFVLFSSSAENDRSFPPLAIAQCSCHAKQKHFLAEGPPQKMGGGEESNTCRHPALVLGDDGFPGFPHLLVGQMKYVAELFFSKHHYVVWF